VTYMVDRSGNLFRRMREIDYRALRLLVERSVGGSRLKRDLELKRYDKAWREGRLGHPETEDPENKWRLCEARFMLGDYSSWTGWEYRSPWSAGVWHNQAKWEDFGGLYVNQGGCWFGHRCESLYIYGEQGIGDEVCFGQAIEDVKELVDEVVLETDPRLLGVFERSFGIKCVPAVYEENNGEKIRKFRDVETPWITLGELVRNFRRRKDAFPRKPYITADPEQVQRFAKYAGRTGISWRGAQGSYSSAEFGKLAPSPLALQYDLAWDEEVETPDLDLRDDIEGLLGLLMNLERVITVSTSVAHFAAALGVKTDVILAPLNGIRKNLLPFKWHCEPMFGKTPWYGDNVRVFRDLDEYRRQARKGV
jgi:hypothetical protein